MSDCHGFRESIMGRVRRLYAGKTASHHDDDHEGDAGDRVRILHTDIDEQEWRRGTARNPAFDFLNDPAEDVYTRNDGYPFHDEG
jgi:hypothetical protein